eukprot:6316887-Amphidinium_carterae.2
MMWMYAVDLERDYGEGELEYQFSTFQSVLCAKQEAKKREVGSPQHAGRKKMERNEKEFARPKEKARAMQRASKARTKGLAKAKG